MDSKYNRLYYTCVCFDVFLPALRGSSGYFVLIRSKNGMYRPVSRVEQSRAEQYAILFDRGEKNAA